MWMCPRMIPPTAILCFSGILFPTTQIKPQQPLPLSRNCWYPAPPSKQTHHPEKADRKSGLPFPLPMEPHEMSATSAATTMSVGTAPATRTGWPGRRLPPGCRRWGWRTPLTHWFIRESGSPRSRRPRPPAEHGLAACQLPGWHLKPGQRFVEAVVERLDRKSVV